jgi:Na+/proline symporter
VRTPLARSNEIPLLGETGGYGRNPLNKEQGVRYEQAVLVSCMARIGSVALGVVATFAALFAGRLGPLVNAFNVVSSFLAGPMLGLFLTGMLSARVTTRAVLAGVLLGLITVSVVAWKTEICFFYYALIGLAVTVVVSHAGSIFGLPPRPESIAGLVRGRPPLQTGSVPGLSEETT